MPALSQTAQDVLEAQIRASTRQERLHVPCLDHGNDCSDAMIFCCSNLRLWSCIAHTVVTYTGCTLIDKVQIQCQCRQHAPRKRQRSGVPSLVRR